VANIPRSDELRNRMLLVKMHTFETLQFWQDELQAFEIDNNINVCWTPGSEKWKCAEGYLAVCGYQKALDKLEGLVIWRLFELAKMGLSGTGKYSE